MSKVLLLFIPLFLILPFTIGVSAQSFQGSGQKKLQAEIIEKNKRDCAIITQGECTVYKLEITEEGSEKKEVEVEMSPQDKLASLYDVGDRVFVQEYTVSGESSFAIIGPIRENAIIVLIVIFILITLAIGGKNGFGSLIGLAVSVGVLFLMTIPMIINGVNPILAGFLGAFLVLTFSIYFSHGFNSKSTVALISTLSGVAIICLLTLIFIEVTKLTGYGNEDALYLINQLQKDLNMKGILFASIIVGGVGVMDDVTVNQVSAMQEVYRANPNLTRDYLFRSSMNIGRDHIASMVNTLFIAYAGASMPLVMLLQANNISFREIINNNIFAEEIVRTFIGSIGLILIVPITSFIASFLITKKNSKLKLKPREKMDLLRETNDYKEVT
jgi:uncharacterized membrane protein